MENLNLNHNIKLLLEKAKKKHWSNPKMAKALGIALPTLYIYRKKYDI